MRKLFLIIFSLSVLLSSCVEDELTEINLDGFDDTLSFCEGINADDFVVFNTTTDPFQAILLTIPSSMANDSIFNSDSLVQGSINIMGATRFIYRTYTGDPTSVICQSVPNADISIIDNFDSASGIINYSSEFSNENLVDSTRTLTINFSVTGIDLEVLRIVGEQPIGALNRTVPIN